MNNPEAKFILGAFRPDGRDAGDPLFADALAQAGNDPHLAAWLERQRAFDTALAGKLREIAPPPGLREAILVGARASRPRQRWGIHPAWLAAAAAVVIVATVGLSRRQTASAPALSELATYALNDLADAHDEHIAFPPSLAGVQARLASASLPLPQQLNVNFDELQRHGCRTVRVAGREVFEVCFQHDGTWYHLYAARRRDFAPGGGDARTLFTARGKYASTAWSDAEHVYALVTRAGPEALRRVI